ncbi:TetR/AcrR family transcriptional regulator [Streptomyces sp. NPDC058614]|uniref:TetR/AcrR family transcriptional regulator n=1 Tax=Streptomyces sp. NPDC058614 TaxID=3346557 RepID=UPI00365F7DE7
MSGTKRAARASADATAPASGPRASTDAPASSSEQVPSRAPSGERAPSSPPDVQRPTLIERRKAATRMEIARAAAGLFMRNGLRATRAEDIARAAGIAPRTFYRYFASKEEALGPLFAAGSQRWAETVRDAPAHLTVPEALHHAVVQTLTPGVGVRQESLQWVRSLLRLAEESPALLRVWGEACHTAERTLAEVLAARIPAVPGAVAQPGGPPESGAEVEAAAPVPGAVARPGGAPESGAEVEAAAPESGAMAQPVEAPESGTVAQPGGPLESGDRSPGGHPLPYLELSPELRLSAAVASAAVRVAVEAWAAGDAPATGPAGPVALALRNLGSLRDFPWHAEQATN